MIKFIKDWIWQLPQNLLGILYKTLTKDNIICRINEEAKDFEVYLTRKGGGVTLGKYIFVSQRFTDLSRTIQHESGHVKQSLVLGPLYLLVIGIPSVLHLLIRRLFMKFGIRWNYYSFYTESWANKLAGLK